MDENKKPEEALKFPTITDSMKGIGKQMRENMPHIVIGDDKIPKKPLFNEREQGNIDKIRKWGLIIAVALVVGYAVYRIFFG